MSFLYCQKFLFQRQYGFRSKHPTINPVLHLLNQWAKNKNKNPSKYTLSIFIIIITAEITVSLCGLATSNEGDAYGS